ncbi:MAG: type I-E CRISPR-associated protein Cas7/Cse4/CasC [Bifidobacteriaceae bacterium]|jgi:CRISPR system Cascade subunit CasC|nr:type I-E CRISPR-associated protein Cas7/Cse4/CasC [Bifidobacteriaceae bacterium]MCI1979629.1 type I-E CRISPR-associated protein Cas7/Cse4/CasC [Bifidobacteriaceae bacterium]
MTNNNRTIIEVHALQTTAPGNLNRDDTGSPKSVVYGGALRTRVSSQAWKRQTRLAFNELLDPKDLGLRTKRVVEVLRDKILELDENADAEAAATVAETIFANGAGIKLAAPRAKKDRENEDVERLQQPGYLLFIGNRQFEKLAEVGVKALQEDDPVAAIKAEKKEIKKIVADERAIDVALFGRMVADDTDLNVDAAAQVAHAISVQEIEPESDFFTAVDDVKNTAEDETDAGAAMLGDVEFNAATFYRYANVDADRLRDTLGDTQATAEAVKAFVQAFVTSVPQGKINSFAHATLPELVYVTVRDSQAVNLIGAFERPVEPDYVEHATKALVKREQEFERAYDVTPVKAWVVRIGEDTETADALAENVSLSEALTDLAGVVSSRLDQE